MSAQRTVGEKIRLTAARLAHAQDLHTRTVLQGRLNAQLAAVRGADHERVEWQHMPRTREAGERARAAQDAWWAKALED